MLSLKNFILIIGLIKGCQLGIQDLPCFVKKGIKEKHSIYILLAIISIITEVIFYMALYYNFPVTIIVLTILRHLDIINKVLKKGYIIIMKHIEEYNKQ
jgi:hypothetical protein